MTVIIVSKNGSDTQNEPMIICENFSTIQCTMGITINRNNYWKVKKLIFPINTNKNVQAFQGHDIEQLMTVTTSVLSKMNIRISMALTLVGSNLK